MRRSDVRDAAGCQLLRGSRAIRTFPARRPVSANALRRSSRLAVKILRADGPRSQGSEEEFAARPKDGTLHSCSRSLMQKAPPVAGRAFRSTRCKPAAARRASESGSQRMTA